MKINIFKELEKNRMYQETFMRFPPMPEEVLSWPYNLQELWCWLATPSDEEIACGLFDHDYATMQVKKSKAYKEWREQSEKSKRSD